MLTPLVQRVTHDVIRANKLPPVFEHCVQWDLLGTCLAHYDARGHFPCGWAGSFPAGQLIAY